MLLIVVTLICAYLACWGPTKRAAVAKRPVGSAGSVAPLVIYQDELTLESPPGGKLGMGATRRYYLWLFDYEIKLPMEKNVPIPESFFPAGATRRRSSYPGL
jgi:hypothetical protein